MSDIIKFNADPIVCKRETDKFNTMIEKPHDWVYVGLWSENGSTAVPKLWVYVKNRPASCVVGVRYEYRDQFSTAVCSAGGGGYNRERHAMLLCFKKMGADVIDTGRDVQSILEEFCKNHALLQDGTNFLNVIKV